MVSVPKCTKGRGLTMKKWEKPELKVLGVESTKTVKTPIYPETGNVFICEGCNAHQRNDISEINSEYLGNGRYRSDTSCHCGSNIWKQEIGRASCRERV